MAAVAADADHAGRRQGRRLRNGRRFGGRGRRPAPVNNFNGGNFPAVPSAVPQSVPAAPRRRPRPAGRRRPRPQPAFVPEPLPVPVVDPIPQAVPAVARGRQHQQLPRGAKSIDVEGTRFTNQSPDEFGNYNFQYVQKDVEHCFYTAAAAAAAATTTTTTTPTTPLAAARNIAEIVAAIYYLVQIESALSLENTGEYGSDN